MVNYTVVNIKFDDFRDFPGHILNNSKNKCYQCFKRLENNSGKCVE